MARHYPSPAESAVVHLQRGGAGSSQPGVRGATHCHHVAFRQVPLSVHAEHAERTTRSFGRRNADLRAGLICSGLGKNVGCYPPRRLGSSRSDSRSIYWFSLSLCAFSRSYFVILSSCTDCERPKRKRGMKEEANFRSRIDFLLRSSGGFTTFGLRICCPGASNRFGAITRLSLAKKRAQGRECAFSHLRAI